MSSVDSAWHADYVTLMTEIFPSCTTANVWRTNQVERVDLREMLTAGKLTLPNYSVFIGAARDMPEWGALSNRCVGYPVTATALLSTKDAGAAITGGYDITSYLLDLGEEFSQGLLGYTGGNFQILEEWPTIDVSEVGSLNSRIQGIDWPVYSLAVSALLIVGESV